MHSQRMASIALRNIRCIDYLAYGTIFMRAMFRPKIKPAVFFFARKAVDERWGVVQPWDIIRNKYCCTFDLINEGAYLSLLVECPVIKFVSSVCLLILYVVFFFFFSAGKHDSEHFSTCHHLSKFDFFEHVYFVTCKNQQQQQQSTAITNMNSSSVCPAPSPVRNIACTWHANGRMMSWTAQLSSSKDTMNCFVKYSSEGCIFKLW